MLKSTNNSGFQMSFDNNLTISIQWGPLNMCDNWNSDPNSCSSCRNAEVAVWVTDSMRRLNASTFFNRGISNDDVIGYIAADDIAEYIYNVKRHPYVST